jgi:hypothetical protein
MNDPIQPISTRPREVSVTVPLSQALERVKLILFRPFDLGKWFTIGFCAWLAYLGERGGSGFNGGNSFSNHGNHTGAQQQFQHAWSYVVANLAWILPLFIALIALGLGLWVLFMWLGSRGKFMFLHCVALNQAEVTVPWNRYAKEAMSLFYFRLVLGLIGSIVNLSLIAVVAIPVIMMVKAGAASVPGVMIAAGGLLLFIAALVVFLLILSLTDSFVVPIMYLRGTKCLAAWRELRGLLAAHLGGFVIYFLFTFVLSLAIAMILVFVMLLTCCIAGCLMAIPYIGTVILLPVLVFKRSYSLYYFAQYGKEYDVFGKV